MMIPVAKNHSFNFPLWTLGETFVRMIISALVIGRLNKELGLFYEITMVLFAYWIIRPLINQLEVYLHCRKEAKYNQSIEEKNKIAMTKVARRYKK